MAFPYSLYDLPQTHTDKHRPKIIKIASISSLGSFMSSRLMAQGARRKAQGARLRAQGAGRKAESFK